MVREHRKGALSERVMEGTTGGVTAELVFTAPQEVRRASRAQRSAGFSGCHGSFSVVGTGGTATVWQERTLAKAAGIGSRGTWRSHVWTQTGNRKMCATEEQHFQIRFRAASSAAARAVGCNR